MLGRRARGAETERGDRWRQPVRRLRPGRNRPGGKERAEPCGSRCCAGSTSARPSESPWPTCGSWSPGSASATSGPCSPAATWCSPLPTPGPKSEVGADRDRLAHLAGARGGDRRLGPRGGADRRGDRHDRRREPPARDRRQPVPPAGVGHRRPGRPRRSSILCWRRTGRRRRSPSAAARPTSGARRASIRAPCQGRRQGPGRPGDRPQLEDDAQAPGARRRER